MRTIFWDVDTQNDFMKKEGKLSIEGAEAILDNLAKLTQYARAQDIQVVASICDHTIGDDEISDQPDFEHTFPSHCIRGTKGQQKVEQTEPRNAFFIPHHTHSVEELKNQLMSHRGEIIIQKRHFDVFSNPLTETVLEVLQPERIVVYGVALDVCDKYAIEGFLHRSSAQIILVQDAARAIREERRSELLTDWKRRGVKIVSTKDILGEKLIPR